MSLLALVACAWLFLTTVSGAKYNVHLTEPALVSPASGLAAWWQSTAGCKSQSEKLASSALSALPNASNSRLSSSKIFGNEDFQRLLAPKVCFFRFIRVFLFLFPSHTSHVFQVFPVVNLTNATRNQSTKIIWTEKNLDFAFPKAFSCEGNEFLMSPTPAVLPTFGGHPGPSSPPQAPLRFYSMVPLTFFFAFVVRRSLFLRLKI